jgi:hypothetical protein
MSDFLFLSCPHCFEEIIVQKTELNCKIFRHGVLKQNYQQINPHASKQECDSLVEQGKIYGCGKPFRVVETESCVFITEICDYI